MAKQVKQREMQTNYSHPLLVRDLTPNVWCHYHVTNFRDPPHELSNKLSVWCCKAFIVTALWLWLWLRMIDSYGEPYVSGGVRWQQMFTNDEQPTVWRNGVFGYTVAQTDALIQDSHVWIPHNPIINIKTVPRL